MWSKQLVYLAASQLAKPALTAVTAAETAEALNLPSNFALGLVDVPSTT